MKMAISLFLSSFVQASYPASFHSLSCVHICLVFTLHLTNTFQLELYKHCTTRSSRHQSTHYNIQAVIHVLDIVEHMASVVGEVYCHGLVLILKQWKEKGKSSTTKTLFLYFCVNKS